MVALCVAFVPYFSRKNSFPHSRALALGIPVPLSLRLGRCDSFFFSSSSLLVVLCRRGSSPPGVSVISNHPTPNQSVGKPFHKKGKGTEPKSLLASTKKPKNLSKQITHKLPRSVQQSKEKGGKVSIFHSASSSYPFFLCCLLCWGETRHNLGRPGGSVLCILIACK